VRAVRVAAKFSQALSNSARASRSRLFSLAESGFTVVWSLVWLSAVILFTGFLFKKARIGSTGATDWAIPRRVDHPYPTGTEFAVTDRHLAFCALADLACLDILSANCWPTRSHVHVHGHNMSRSQKNTPIAPNAPIQAATFSRTFPNRRRSDAAKAGTAGCGTGGSISCSRRMKSLAFTGFNVELTCQETARPGGAGNSLREDSWFMDTVSTLQKYVTLYRTINKRYRLNCQSCPMPGV
jgi:hypothetical protein